MRRKASSNGHEIPHSLTAPPGPPLRVPQQSGSCCLIPALFTVLVILLLVWAIKEVVEAL